MKEFNEIGGYDQMIITEKGDIIDVSCNCIWMSLHPYAWKEGNTICKHLKLAIKKYKCSISKKGKLNPRYGKSGKRIINRLGYIYLYKPEHPNATKQGYIPEHKIIMEKNIGRLMNKNEIIHHINGIKTDNRIENIKIVTRGEHNKIHIRNKEGISKWKN